MEPLFFRLPRSVSIGYTTAMKDVGLRIRVQKELREEFLAACKAQDKPAAQVLREFMRSYVDKQPATKRRSAWHSAKGDVAGAPRRREDEQTPKQ